jgi:hypothetical protein
VLGQIIGNDHKNYVKGSLASNGGGIPVEPAGGSAGGEPHPGRADKQWIGAKTESRVGLVDLTIFDSVASSHSLYGFAASGNVNASINHSVSARNRTGLYASGSKAALRIGSSTVTPSKTRVAILTGATMNSYRNNQIDGNALAGSAIPIIALK